ncbi:MAG: O-antigen ligase family protein, partial [Myxococcales bacterium]|nr:O-antigen ligase family protein [Myxococcales bacterium]
MLTGFAALGLGLDGRRSEPGYVLLAAALFGASLYQRSTGGTLALLIGLSLWIGLSWRRRGERGPKPRTFQTVVFRTSIVIALASVTVLGAETLEEGFSQTTLDEKVAAYRDAPALIRDHAWFGIGRGAYWSVYSAYRTEPLVVSHTHPETLPIQLISEWGVPVGSMSLVALISWLFMRLRGGVRARDRVVLCGAVALVLQNLVDFSLEITGVALTFAALVASSRTQGRRRVVRAASHSRAAYATLVPVLAFAGLTRALAIGDLRADVSLFAERLSATPPESVDDELEKRIRAHPANALGWLVSARSKAYGPEPNLEGAIVDINKAIVLAPTFSLVHSLAGEVLWRARLRAQALLEFRTAWALTNQPSLILARLLDLELSPAELVGALPRSERTPLFPSLDAIVWAIPAARSVKGDAFAQTLLKEAFFDGASTRSLVRFAQLAVSLGEVEAGLDASELVVAQEDADSAALATVLQLARGVGQPEQALGWVDRRKPRDG